MQNPHKKQLHLLLVILTSLAALFGCSQQADEEVFQANGIKIGEVSQTTAIIWTRITEIEKPLSDGLEFTSLDRKIIPKIIGYEDHELGLEKGYGYQLPEGASLDDTPHAVPGTRGEVRLSYWEAQNDSSKQVLDWLPVDSDSDYTKHFPLSGLKPRTKYALKVDARKNKSSKTSSTVFGFFTTAPSAEAAQPITFAVTTCTDYYNRDDGDKGHRIFKTMKSMNLDFMVHAGDVVYYDLPGPYATHIDAARYRWNRMFGLTNLVELLKEVPSYWMKDDHDSWDNDCWPTMQNEMGLFTYEQGKQVFDEQVPMSDKRHFRTFRWGKDLQIWMVEVRDFRSPNFDPDGPDKSLWGKEQVRWFKQTVEASDATFKILISPTPMVGPDHLWKGDMNDNHADEGWSYEGDMLREYIASQKNMYFICGDRHWQYISRHPKTGMLEYAAGASSDKHAISMLNDDTSMHLYYGPDKGGFLTVTMERDNGVPTARFRHHGVNGELFNEDVRVSLD
jgi:alkaline phosphatase D